VAQSASSFAKATEDKWSMAHRARTILRSQQAEPLQKRTERCRVRARASPLKRSRMKQPHSGGFGTILRSQQAEPLHGGRTMERSFADAMRYPCPPLGKRPIGLQIGATVVNAMRLPDVTGADLEFDRTSSLCFLPALRSLGGVGCLFVAMPCFSLVAVSMARCAFSRSFMTSHLPHTPHACPRWRRRMPLLSVAT